MAWGSSARGTASATVEFHAGDINAVQLPDTKIRNNTPPGPVILASDSQASRMPDTACTVSANWISLRRSVMSASTPAGRENRNIGRKTAVCTSAARNDEPLSSTIIHDAAMVCIALPMK